MQKRLILVLLGLLITSPVFAGDQDGAEADRGGKSPHLVPQATGVVTLDGRLEEELWSGALRMELKYEVTPGDNTPPPVRTEVLLAYSADSLYVGFRCFDPEPGAIRARLSDRDHDPGDDYVGVVLDTFNDERRSYFLWSNPLGVQEDAVLTNEEYDISWDTLYESEGCIAEWGWSVEMRVPFRSLSFQRTDGPQVWGFDAFRNYPRGNFYQIRLSRVPRGTNCQLCELQKIKGFEGARPGRDLELNPTVTYARTDERPSFPEGGFETASNEAEIGLTAQWGVTPSVNLAATLNPDFSQVEADAWLLDINEPFALAYEEKRPFFTEGADFFSTEFNAVYTRTVRDPSLGFKVSGKEGANSFGAFVLQDDVTNLIFPGSQYSRATSIDAPSWSGVFRYKRDVGDKYTIGGLFTGREGDEYHNRVAGIDGEFRFTAADRISAQVLYSDTDYPRATAAAFGQRADSFWGRAFKLLYSHTSREAHMSAIFENINSGFRADLGFMPKVDFRRYQVEADYRFWNDSGGWWWVFLVNGGFSYIENQTGDLLNKSAYGILAFRGALHTGVDFIAKKSREVFIGREFDMTDAVFRAWILPSSTYAFEFDSQFGGRIDYTHARPGERLRLNPIVSLTPGSRLSFSLDHTFERMSVTEGRLYTANVSQFSAKYQLSTRAFVRAILQHVDYDYNTSLYAFPLEREYRYLFSQLLFSYKVNPRTVLFVGYTNSYEGSRDFGLAQKSKTVFIKLGYALQL